VIHHVLDSLVPNSFALLDILLLQLTDSVGIVVVSETFRYRTYDVTMAHVMPSPPSPTASSSVTADDLKVFPQERQGQQLPRSLKLIRYWACFTARWTIENSTRLHIWPACGLSALASFIFTSVCLWSVVSDTSCMTSLNQRIRINVAVGDVITALTLERDVSVSMAECR
jgi:hypothetical protein